MKCSTANWTVAVAAVALLGLPVVVTAQTPPATQPPATAQPAPQPPADPAQATASASQGSAQEHLRQAKAALDDVGTANLAARARTQVTELKKRIATLERMTASGNTGAMAATQAKGTTRVSRSTASWGAEVAAMDKIVTSLLGISPTGTTGTTSKASTTVTLDDATRTKLTEFRTHLTAFATAMSGQPPTASTTPAPAPSTPPPTTEPAQPPPATTPPQEPTPPTPQTTQPAAQTTAPAAKVDAEAAKRHLTEARNTLSQLTQLPAAAQLTGEARTQVAQLISNFNELITTQSEWRASYGKVAANLTALLGPDTGAAEPSPTGTTGAVGTSGGGITIDPAIRTKLVEMRRHLAEFERASGGGASAPDSTAAPEKTTPQPDPTPTPAAPATKPAPEPPSPATPATPTTTPTTTTTTTTPTAAASSDALTHIAAIEALLKSQNEAGGMTLDKAQVDLLRSHIAELRKLLEKK